MKIRIKKCYLVQILDNNDNEVKSEYVFGDRKEAEQTGRELKREIQEK